MFLVQMQKTSKTSGFGGNTVLALNAGVYSFDWLTRLIGN